MFIPKWTLLGIVSYIYLVQMLLDVCIILEVWSMDFACFWRNNMFYFRALRYIVRTDTANHKRALVRTDRVEINSYLQNPLVKWCFCVLIRALNGCMTRGVWGTMFSYSNLGILFFGPFLSIYESGWEKNRDKQSESVISVLLLWSFI